MELAVRQVAGGRQQKGFKGYNINLRLIPKQQAPLDIPPYPVVSKPEILIGGQHYGQHDGQQLSDRINWHGRPDGLSAGSVCPTVELTEEDLADFSTFIQQAFELGLHEPSCKLQNTMIGELLEKKFYGIGGYSTTVIKKKLLIEKLLFV